MHHDVLIAEHDVVSRTRLKAILQGLGYTPRTFENGLNAWEAYEEKPSQIVICDRQTPGLDGISFCSRVRSRASLSYTFFILVTASFTTSETYTAAAVADVDDFLVKPLRRDAVWRRLHVARRVLRFAQHIHKIEQRLPICTSCKRILGKGSEHPTEKWQQLEEYARTRVVTQVEPAICPECLEKESQ